MLLARCEQVQGPAALCVIERLHRTRDRHLLHELQCEARHAVRMRHPGLLQMRQLAFHKEQPYAVLEYVGGRSLASVLNLSAVLGRAPLSVGVACHVIAQVADALDYLHTRTDRRGCSYSLSHGDVSPSRIWLAPDGRVKLMGFGTKISRRVARFELRRKWADIGREMLYAPPFRLARNVSASLSDLYALTVVLLETLLGRHLWSAQVSSEWRWGGLPEQEVERHLRWLRLPSGLDDVIRDALRCAPSGRVSTAAKLRDALRLHARNCEWVATELGWLEHELPWRVLPWEVDPLSGA